MEIVFVNPGIDYMIQSILAFQSEGESAFWSEPIYHFYPQLDRAYATKLPHTQRLDYMEQTLREVYTAEEKAINAKAELYSKHWANCKGQITAALSDAFGVDCNCLFNDLQCNVSMNPIEPRFIRERRFDIFYLNSERGAIGESIHEMIHFVWFYVWNRVFKDNYDEYERPSLKWILSEMVVESVMKDNRLSSLNPYFPRENGGCIYPYFFNMKIDNFLVLDVLDDMYRSHDIVTFMKNSYAYCQKHESEIRLHIDRAEGADR